MMVLLPNFDFHEPIKQGVLKAPVASLQSVHVRDQLCHRELKWTEPIYTSRWTTDERVGRHV